MINQGCGVNGLAYTSNSYGHYVNNHNCSTLLELDGMEMNEIAFRLKDETNKMSTS